MKRILISFLMVLGSAGLAAAVVDGPRFVRDARKLGLDPATSKVRHLCICQDGGANHRHVGYLVLSQLNVVGGYHVTSTCQIPTLSGADSSYVSAQNCATFELLHK